MALNITLPGYYDRTPEFDAAGYEDLLFIASRALQSSEVNEIQTSLLNRFIDVLSFVFRDGAVLSGLPPVVEEINALTCSVILPPTLIYIAGKVYSVPEATLTCSTVGVVPIGVWLQKSVVTADTDARLRDPAVGARNFNEVGAARVKTQIFWAIAGTNFYSIYTLNNGAIVDQTPPALSNTLMQVFRQYDFDANGSYIVKGLQVSAIDSVPGFVTFSISEGIGNTRGFKTDKPTGTRVIYANDPDLETVQSEPKTFTAITGGTTAIQLNRFPVQSIGTVIITYQVTSTLTKGVANGMDTLPQVSILNIQSVVQGATTYVQGTSYALNGDKVDWALGGIEPAPGSNYQVTYQYLAAATPTAVNLNAGSFSITGGVQGSLVITDYLFKLPRKDRLCLDTNGNIARVKGISSRFVINPPNVPDALLSLATVTYGWILNPTVINDGIVAMPFSELQAIKTLLLNVFDLLAQNTLLSDIALREPSTKKGLFVDPFLDDLQRNQGVAQTAAVFRGIAQLPISAQIHFPANANNAVDLTLPFDVVGILEVTQRTGFSRINPYQAFDPIPASIILNPAVDQWVVQETIWSSSQSEYFSQFIPGRPPPGIRDGQIVTTTTARNELVGVQSRAVAFLRRITVAFSVFGFSAAEGLLTLKFDGLTIPTPGQAVANSSGAMFGSFVIPPNVTSGTKLVEFFGEQGSYGGAFFVGSGRIETTVMQQINTVLTRQFDPLAQTFRLAEARHLIGVSLYFTHIGDRQNKVVIEIRESENGIPTSTTLVDGILAGNDIVLNAWNRIDFSRPQIVQANTEYAIVILTDDALHSVAIAELGKFDSNGNPVSTQPYTVGVLLKSSNAVTWTPFQEADLSFVLHAARFTALTQSYLLGSITQLSALTLSRVAAVATLTTAREHGFITGDSVLIAGATPVDYNGVKVITRLSDTAFTYAIAGTPNNPTGTITAVLGDATDLIVLANIARTNNSTLANFTVDTATRSYRLDDNAGLSLPALLNEPATLSVHLSGTANLSPIVFAGSQVVYGEVAPTANYVSRSFPCPPNSTLRVTLSVSLPSPALLTVEAQTAANTWVPCVLGTTLDLGSGWIEQTYSAANISPALNLVAFRLLLSGTFLGRPLLANLRAVVI